MIDEKELNRLMKEFIENPSIKIGTKIMSSGWCYGCVREMNEVWDDRSCPECVWYLVRTARGKGISDEMLSTMVLDAMQMLAAYEAKYGW